MLNPSTVFYLSQYSFAFEIYMAFLITATRISPQVAIVLPNPEFADSEAEVGEAFIKRTRSLKLRYRRKKDGRRKTQYEFRVTRRKGEEFYQFYRLFGGKELEILDHKDQKWFGWISVNPVDLETIGAALDAPPGSFSMMGFQLEIEAFKQ
jgi:hypothetical protein